MCDVSLWLVYYFFFVVFFDTHRGLKMQDVANNTILAKQGSPNPSIWKVWSKVITHLYCVKSHSGILRKIKLGYWLTSNSFHTQSHHITYSPNEQEVYEHSKQGIK